MVKVESPALCKVESPALNLTPRDGGEDTEIQEKDKLHKATGMENVKENVMKSPFFAVGPYYCSYKWSCGTPINGRK